MKILCYLAVITAFFSCKENSSSGETSTSEVDTIAEFKSPDDSLESLRNLKSVDDIKLEHSYITSKIGSGNIDSASFSYNCHDEKQGEVTYFFDKGQLRLIRHTYDEYSHFSATDEYFIKDGAPFFVYYHHMVWNFVNQNQTEDKITEKRFYIIDNKATKCLQKKFTNRSDSEASLKSNIVPNKEVECTSLEPLLEDFELLFKLKDQKEDLTCLED